LLEVRDVVTVYGKLIVLQGVSIELPEGQVRALLGANASGKSTLLRVISGMIPVFSGEILFEGKSIKGKAQHEIAAMGIAHCLEGRRIFPHMSVKDNLEMGAYLCKKKLDMKEVMDYVLTLFPVLKQRMRQKANTLSGGERQMLGIGQILMSRPKVLLVDEPSQGLSPLFVSEVGKAMHQICQGGTSVLWAEQNARAALKWSDFAYLLGLGKIATCGECTELQNSDMIRKVYLGL